MPGPSVADHFRWNGVVELAGERLDHLIARTVAAPGTEAVIDRVVSTSPTRRDVQFGIHRPLGPAEIADRMQQYADRGIDRVYFQLLDLQDLEHVEYLGTEVLPRLPR